MAYLGFGGGMQSIWMGIRVGVFIGLGMVFRHLNLVYRICLLFIGGWEDVILSFTLISCTIRRFICNVKVALTRMPSAY